MRFLLICSAIVGVMAEPPRLRPARFRYQRQELAPSTTESQVEFTTDPSGPYPPSGWNPSGAPFTLPIDTTPTPDSYGPPKDSEVTGPYPPSGWTPSGASFTLPVDTTSTPAESYGTPEKSKEDSAPYPPSGWMPLGQMFTLPQEQSQPPTSYGIPENTYSLPDNTYGAPSTDASTTKNPDAETLVEPIEVQKSIGTYYVLLPNGQLQRIEFVTENDIQNMKYTARLQLRDRVPLLIFGP